MVVVHSDANVVKTDTIERICCIVVSGPLLHSCIMI